MRPTRPSRSILESMESRRLFAGIPIGTPGSYADSGNDLTKALDNNPSTYFDAPTSQAWVGLDYGNSPISLSSVSLTPRPGFAWRMVGGQIQGSNDQYAWTTLATITSEPAPYSPTSYPIADTSSYRFVRYLSPNDGFGNLAEFQPAGTQSDPHPNPGPLVGTPIGSPGSWNNSGNTFDKALDSSTSTFFDAPTPNSNFVGYDFSQPATLSSVKFYPRPGYESRMTGGQFQVSTDGSSWTTLATISQTPDSSVPTTLAISDPGAYRFARYLSPEGSYGNIADLHFYGSTQSDTRLPAYATPQGPAAPNHPASAAIDDDLSTYYEAAQSPGGVQLTFGSYRAEIHQIQFAPAPGQSAAMVGGKFQWQGELTPWRDVVTITSAPAEGALTTLDVSYPYDFYSIRYVGPDGSTSPIAEFHVLGKLVPPSFGNEEPAVLTGTPVGTAGSWNNSGNDLTKAFDNNPNTFFDAPTPQAAVGLHLNEPSTLTAIRVTPRAGFASRMVGGQFQSSNDGVTWETFYTISSAPAEGQPTTYDMTSTWIPVSDYFRYLSPDGGYGNIAELQFIGYAPGPVV